LGVPDDAPFLLRLLVSLHNDWRAFSEICYGSEALCTPEFWSALLRDLYWTFYALLLGVEITHGLKEWYDATFPPLHGDVNTEYNFEEKIFLDLARMEAPSEKRMQETFERLRDGFRPSEEDLRDFASRYPTAMIFLAFSGRYRERLLAIDYADYTFLPARPKEEERALREGKVGRRLRTRLTLGGERAHRQHDAGSSTRGPVSAPSSPPLLLTAPDGRLADFTRHGGMLLHAAVEDNNAPAAAFLLEWRGPRAEFVDPRPQAGALLSRVSQMRYLEFLELLLEWRGPYGEFIDVSRHDALVCASESGHLDVLDRLLAWRGPHGEFSHPGEWDSLSLEAAARMGHAIIVERLLAWRGPRGEYVDASLWEGESKALLVAARMGHLDILEILAEWEGPGGEYVDPTLPRNAPLIEAAAHGHTDVVDLLLDWPDGEGLLPFVDPTDQNNEALIAAACAGHAETVKALLRWEDAEYVNTFSNGLPVEALDVLNYVNATARGNEALRCARKRGHEDVVDVLLSWSGPDGERVTD